MPREPAPASQGTPLRKSGYFTLFERMFCLVVYLRTIYDLGLAAYCAEIGGNMICIDAGGKWAEFIRKGEFPDSLPGLKKIILRNQRKGTLRLAENLDGVDRDFVMCVQRGILHPTAEDRETVELALKSLLKKRNKRKS